MREYGKSYFKTLLKVLAVAGVPFLVMSATSDPVALYFVFCSFMVAAGGPIAIGIEKIYGRKSGERRAS